MSDCVLCFSPIVHHNDKNLVQGLVVDSLKFSKKSVLFSLLFIVLRPIYINRVLQSFGSDEDFTITWRKSIRTFLMITVRKPSRQAEEVPREYRVIGFAGEANRPFYSCVKFNQAFVWKWGWGWPWNDRDAKLVSMITEWFTYEKQQGLYHNKVNSSLTPVQRLGN